MVEEGKSTREDNGRFCGFMSTELVDESSLLSLKERAVRTLFDWDSSSSCGWLRFNGLLLLLLWLMLLVVVVVVEAVVLALGGEILKKSSNKEDRQ